MKSFLLHILALCLICVRLSAQEKFDAKLFESFNNKDRYAYALKIVSVIEKDSVQLTDYLQRGGTIARQKEDYATEVLLQMQYFNYLYYVLNHKSIKLIKDVAIKAMHQAEAYNLPIQLNIIRIHYGGFLFHQEEYDKAYEMLLRAYNALEEIGFAKMRYYPGAPLSEVLYYPALNFYNLQDYANAIKFLQTITTFPNEKDYFTTWQAINTLGLCYLQNNQPQQAIQYFQKGYEYAKKIKSEVWQSISYGNIGNALIKLNKYPEALPYVKTDYEIAKKKGDRESIFHALSNLMIINFDQKKYREVETAIKDAEKIYNELRAENYSPGYFNEFKLITIYRMKAGLYETQGKTSEALFYNKKYIKLKDSLDKRNYARKYKLIQQRLEAEKYVAKVSQLESEKKTEIWKRNGAILVLIVGLVVGLIKYRDIRIKQKQADTALADFTKNFKTKSELADNLQKEIDTLIQQGQQVEVLEQLKKKTILTEDDWSEFKVLFDKVYPDFINSLFKNNPEVTHAEVRLLALSKLNLRDQEMANMLGISIDAIRKARYRFKKKSTA